MYLFIPIKFMFEFKPITFERDFDVQNDVQTKISYNV